MNVFEKIAPVPSNTNTVIGVIPHLRELLYLPYKYQDALVVRKNLKYTKSATASTTTPVISAAIK